MLRSKIEKGSALAAGGQWVNRCMISSGVRQEEVCTGRSQTHGADGVSNGLLKKRCWARVEAGTKGCLTKRWGEGMVFQTEGTARRCPEAGRRVKLSKNP